MQPNEKTQLTSHWMQAQSAILAYILSGVGNFADAEDILQQVALDVSASFEKYDSGRPFIPWAMQIAKRRVVDFYRSRPNAVRLLDEVDLEHLAEAHQNLATTCAPSGEVTDRLELCLNKLPQKSRKLIDLRYRDGMKPAEIAQNTGRSSGAIRVALNKIRNALQRCIMDAMEGSPPNGA